MPRTPTTAELKQGCLLTPWKDYEPIINDLNNEFGLAIPRSQMDKLRKMIVLTSRSRIDLSGSRIITPVYSNDKIPENQMIEILIDILRYRLKSIGIEANVICDILRKIKLPNRFGNGSFFMARMELRPAEKKRHYSKIIIEMLWFFIINPQYCIGLGLDRPKIIIPGLMTSDKKCTVCVSSNMQNIIFDVLSVKQIKQSKILIPVAV